MQMAMLPKKHRNGRVTQQAKIKNGKIGEVLVELELLKRDWHVERLDGAARAVNGDLIAIKGLLRLVIQVKSALSWGRPSFGHATGFLEKGTPFFNKDNPTVLADALVTVCGPSEKPIFHVFEISEAESLAQEHALVWFKTPTKKGEQRSPNFPQSFRLSDPIMKAHENNWNILAEIGESLRK
jgi:hypothetical protein